MQKSYPADVLKHNILCSQYSFFKRVVRQLCKNYWSYVVWGLFKSTFARGIFPHAVSDFSILQTFFLLVQFFQWFRRTFSLKHWANLHIGVIIVADFVQQWQRSSFYLWCWCSVWNLHMMHVQKFRMDFGSSNTWSSSGLPSAFSTYDLNILPIVSLSFHEEISI